jgi:hypothetical protein
VQPLGSFPAFYGTRRFITAFTRALHHQSSPQHSIQSLKGQQDVISHEIRLFITAKRSSSLKLSTLPFCDMKSCCSLKVNASFGGTYRLRLHDVKEHESLTKESRRHGVSPRCDKCPHSSALPHVTALREDGDTNYDVPH